MPTTTLFQTLRLGQTTWHIEVVSPTADTAVIRTPDRPVKGVGVDPWPLAPLYVDYHGVGHFDATRQLPQIIRKSRKAH